MMFSNILNWRCLNQERLKAAKYNCQKGVKKITVYQYYEDASNMRKVKQSKAHTVKDGSWRFAKTKLSSYFQNIWKAVYILYRQDGNYINLDPVWTASVIRI